MIDDARIGPGSAAYRGFLFSDMRGFTAFAERHGNAVAAAAVERFLGLARSAIARYQGSEVMTEGDAIHAVFASASSAVLCGLEIVESAAALKASQPDMPHPLGLGVGVHAGEAVETAEGYIGRAVNIAARLCAAARPGEVLVSSTVKGITHASINVGFIPRGTRRLKGIRDPIMIYAVTRDPNARAPRAVPRPVLVGLAGAAVLGVAVILALGGSQLLGRPTASPSASESPKQSPSAAAPLGNPVVMGPLLIGSYRTQEFQPPFTFDILDVSWTANRDVPEMLGLIRDAGPRGNLHVLRVDRVITEPCVEGGETTETGIAPGPKSLLTQLEALQHLVVSERVPMTVGGFPAEAVQIFISEGVLAACGGMTGDDVALLVVGDEVWRGAPGEPFRLISVDVEGQAVAFVMSTNWAQTQSVQELEDLYLFGNRVIDSVEF